MEIGSFDHDWDRLVSDYCQETPESHDVDEVQVIEFENDFGGMTLMRLGCCGEKRCGGEIEFAADFDGHGFPVTVHVYPKRVRLVGEVWYGGVECDVCHRVSGLPSY